MWKYIKGTEKDFESVPPTVMIIFDGIDLVAQREWIEEPHIETKSEQQQQQLHTFLDTTLNNFYITIGWKF